MSVVSKNAGTPLNDTCIVQALLAAIARCCVTFTFYSWPASTVSGDRGPFTGEHPIPIISQAAQSEHRLMPTLAQLLRRLCGQLYLSALFGLFAARCPHLCRAGSRARRHDS